MIMLAYGFQNCEGADCVILQKHVWVSNASINMRLRCNVNNSIYLMYEPTDKQRIANVAFNECISFIVFNIMQISRVSAYSYLVHIYQFVIRVFFKDVSAKIATDKA
jgi:nitrate reductase NapE component